MCGICGFNSENAGLLKKMMSAIRHRGPDQSGKFFDKGVSLGHVRLSIIDLSEKGRQPIFNEDKSACIVFNGEIYNFHSIKKDLIEKGHKFSSGTDTEAIIHAYEAYGFDCVNKFNGDFAFAIYDSSKKIIFLARDRLGIKPLYYYFRKEKKGAKFVFASEIKAILEDDEIKRSVNACALNDYILLRYVPGKETMFENIFRLLSGHYLVFHTDSGKMEEKKYWDIEPHAKDMICGSEDFFSRQVASLFESAVKRRLMSDVPLGVYLSGGIDSSSVVAMMALLNKKNNVSEPIKTFSVGFEHDRIGNELDYARKVSEHFGTEHEEILIQPEVIKELPKMVWHLDEPIADPAIVPNFILSRNAKKKVTVILTGDGADELFAGYDQYKFFVMGEKMKHLPSSLAAAVPKIAKNLPKVLLDRIYKYSTSTGEEMFNRSEKFLALIRNNKSRAYTEIISTFDEDEKAELLKKNIPTDYDALNRQYFSGRADILSEATYFDTKNYLPEDLLMKPDKMCMAHAIEARVPFLDHELVEFSFRIPSNLKLNGFTTKYIMKKAFSKILPREIIHRRKQPFQVPIDRWIEKEFKEVFLGMADRKMMKEYFDARQIEKIFDNYNTSKLFYARQLWALLIFQTWHDIYITQSLRRF